MSVQGPCHLSQLSLSPQEGQEAKVGVFCGSHSGDSWTQWTRATDGLRGAGVTEGVGKGLEGGMSGEQ